MLMMANLKNKVYRFTLQKDTVDEQNVLTILNGKMGQNALHILVIT